MSAQASRATPLTYSVLFLALSLACAVSALRYRTDSPWAVLLFIELTLCFLVLGLAYAGLGVRPLMKRPSGRRSPFGTLILAPYVLLSVGLLQVYRRLSKDPPFVEVAPNVFLGRRLFAREASGLPWKGVLDLAGERGPDLPGLRD